MKKLLFTLFLVLGLGFTYAQQKPVKTTEAKKEIAQKKIDKKVTKAENTADKKIKKANKAEKKVNTTTNSVPLKKDGTPDKRYKSTTKHVKKDGTPDKRYKENQTK